MPLLISILSVSVLVLSIVYDFGFLLILGTNFSEVPTTISDHLRSSLIWIPPVMIMVFFVYVLELFTRRIEQGKTEEELILESPAPKFMAWFRDSPKYPIIGFSLFVPISIYFDIELPLEAWLYSILIIWFILHNFFFHHPRIYSQTSREMYLCTRYLPAIFWFVMFSGVISGNKIREGSDNEFTFKLEKQVITANLIRTYEKYYLLWDNTEKKVKFLSSGKVISFQPSQKTKSNKKINKDT
jgi:hypothetical protein